MTKAKAAKPEPATTIAVEQSPNETKGQVMARLMLGLPLRHGQVASSYGTQMLGKDAERAGIMDNARYVRKRIEAAADGDMTMASHMLAAQAITLDTMFTALAERAFSNMGQYPQTAERYGRLALKAQANARATLEALTKLHQPREQIVKHVHVNEGGQAVVADEFHHHGGGMKNADVIEQCHAAGDTGASPALPGPNPIGGTVPIAGGVGETQMSDARRD